MLTKQTLTTITIYTEDSNVSVASFKMLGDWDDISLILEIFNDLVQNKGIQIIPDRIEKCREVIKNKKYSVRQTVVYSKLEYLDYE